MIRIENRIGKGGYVSVYSYGVDAVPELDSHPDFNKGPDPRTLRWSNDVSHRYHLLVLGLPRPSIEPITFPCRTDVLRVMPRTRVR